MPGGDLVLVEDAGALLGAGHETEHRFDDGVAGEGYPLLGDPFSQEIVDAHLGGSTTEVAQVIGDDPVVLFGHRPVVAAEPALDVAEKDAAGIGRQGSGDDGVGVALDQDRPRGILGEVAVESLDAFSDLMAA